MHQEPDMGFDPRSSGSRPGPKAGTKPLRHPGIPCYEHLTASHQKVPDITVTHSMEGYLWSSVKAVLPDYSVVKTQFYFCNEYVNSGMVFWYCSSIIVSKILLPNGFSIYS